MRIGLFGDVHGNFQALEGAWKALSAAGADLFVCTGDVVQYGPEPAECVAFLREHGCDCVQGNCDRAVARGRKSTGDEYENRYWASLAAEALEWTAAEIRGMDRSWLRDLPEEVRFEAGRRIVMVTHGLPGNVSGSLPSRPFAEVCDRILASSRAGVVVVGHTHEPALFQRPAGWISNPGSLGGGTLPSAGTAGLLDMPERGPVCFSMLRVPFDAAAYARKSRDAGLPELFARCLELGRDPRGRWHTDDIYLRQRWAEGKV